MDEHDPQRRTRGAGETVTVSYGQATYTVAEGETVSVTVTLDADPERTVVIPIRATPQGSTTAADYSVTPTSVTFNAGELSQTISVGATQDAVDDDGESVLLGFGMLPSGVRMVSETRSIDEGGTGTYTIVLESEPTAAVATTQRTTRT